MDILGKSAVFPGGYGRIGFHRVICILNVHIVQEIVEKHWNNNKIGWTTALIENDNFAQL